MDANTINQSRSFFKAVTSLGIRFFTLFASVFGIWGVRAAAWSVSTGYFFFRPKRVRHSREFYQVVFPKRSRWFYLGCVWRQFHDMSAGYADTWRMKRGGKIEHSLEGWEYLESSHSSGQGGIIIMSHFGNWDAAARVLTQSGLRLMIFMGERQEEQISQEQKAALSKSGVKVMVSTTKNTPLDGVEAINFLRSGGFVSMAGDITWTERRNGVDVRFMERTVNIPASAHVLALLTGSPVFTFFAIRQGHEKYLFKNSKPWYVTATRRADRKRSIQESAQRYADELEKVIRKHPFQWHVFERFFFPEPEGSDDCLQ